MIDILKKVKNLKNLIIIIIEIMLTYFNTFTYIILLILKIPKKHFNLISNNEASYMIFITLFILHKKIQVNYEKLHH